MTSLAAPDAVEPVVAWRAWSLAKVDGRFRLKSVVAPTLWEPLRALDAVCWRPGLRLFRSRRAPHESPSTSCECGVYGADAATAAAYATGLVYGSRRRVLGRVALWGRVAECERGWRASHAYPSEIVVPEHWFRRSSRTPLEAVALDLVDYCVAITVVDEAELDELVVERAPARL
jgi:hypothetical protein